MGGGGRRAMGGITLWPGITGSGAYLELVSRPCTLTFSADGGMVYERRGPSLD